MFNHHIQEYIQHVRGQISSTVNLYPSNGIESILHTQINTQHSYHLQLGIHQFKGCRTNFLNSQADVLYYLRNFKVLVQLSDISPFPHPNNHSSRTDLLSLLALTDLQKSLWIIVQFSGFTLSHLEPNFTP